MRDKTTSKTQTKAEGTETKRKPGRRPMTAEQKEAAEKQRAAEKKKAENLKPEIFLQYQDADTNLADLVDAAKADFRKAKMRLLILDMKLYVKPEERMAYYVVNGTDKGQVSF